MSKFLTRVRPRSFSNIVQDLSTVELFAAASDDLAMDIGSKLAEETELPLISCVLKSFRLK